MVQEIEPFLGFYAADKTLMKKVKHASNKKQKEPPRKLSRCCRGILISTATCCLLNGLLCFAFSTQIISLIKNFVQQRTALVTGEPMLSPWLSPPLVPLLHVYVFNITNGEEVLNGAVPKTREMGPYVYSATQQRYVVGETWNKEEITFRHRTVYQFLPQLSSGLESDPLTTLNMVMLTGFNKARGQAQLLKSWALPFLTSTGLGTPIVDVTVGGFLFGYEDELACITESDVNQHEDDWDSWEDDSDWDSWDDEDNKVDKQINRTIKRREAQSFSLETEDKKAPNYRNEDGRCVWGILKDLNNTQHDVVKISTGFSDFKTKGQILSVNGRIKFNAWDSECDSIQGGIEPSALPAGLSQDFDLMVSVMCKKINMVAVSNDTWEGVPVTRYSASAKSLYPSSCYCPSPSSPCLPPGTLNLEPCYPHLSLPLAVSFPRYLHGDHSQLPSVLPPNEEDHGMFVTLERSMGVPLAFKVRFQLSAVLNPDPSFPILDKLNTTRLVPLFWASEGFDKPTSWMLWNTRLALSLPSGIQKGVGGLSLILGLILFALALRGKLWTFSEINCCPFVLKS